jgi:hypothetical protein
MDDDFPTHPGAMAVSLAAKGLWATAGAWCSKRLTDVVPDHVLASFGSTSELEAELCAAGMLKRVRGGFRYTQEGLCKIPVKETHEHKRKLKNERQQRWREGRRRRSVDASTRASPLESITRTKDPPLPPASGGHDGSHPNCRACGTSRRGAAPEPRATPMPPPAAEVLHVNGTPARGDTVRAIADTARRAIE